MIFWRKKSPGEYEFTIYPLGFIGLILLAATIWSAFA